MTIRKFFKDLKLFNKCKLSSDTRWKILDVLGYFLNTIYKLAMAFVPGIVCIYFLSPLFGFFVLVAGFYRLILDLTHSNSIKEIYLFFRGSFKNK